MVTFVALRDLEPAQYEHDAADWNGQAEGAAEYAEAFEKQVVTCLAEWEGMTGWLARKRAGEFAAAFGDAPERLRAVASALRHAGAEFKAAQDLLAEALEEAERQGVVVTDSGQVMAAPSPVGKALGTQQQSLVAEGPNPRDVGQIEAKVARALARATRADEALARSLPLIQEGMAWEGDNPAVLSADEAAALLKRAAEGDAEALAELRRHKDQFSDPYFAQELAKTLGAKGLTELPGLMSQHLHEMTPRTQQAMADNRELLGMLSDTLAAAADPDNPAWEASGDSSAEFLDELAREGRSTDHENVHGGKPYAGYWALGQIMGATDGQPPYSTELLDQVGSDMVKWDMTHESRSGLWPESAGPFGVADAPGGNPHRMGTGADPLDGLMQAAATNGEGAQRIFADSDNLNHLLGDRRWPDQGEGLGRALEAATMLDNPQAGEVAADATSVLGERLVGDPSAANELGFLKDSMGRVLGANIDDVGRSIDPMYNPEHRYDPRSLAEVMKFATSDKDGYQALITAEAQYSAAQIANPDGAAKGEVEHAGRVLGFIVEAHIADMNDEAKEADKQSSALRDAVEKGVGLIPGGSLTSGLGEFGGNLFSLARNEATNAAVDAFFATDHLGEVKSVAADHNVQMTELTRDIVRGAVVNNPEVFGGKADPGSWPGSQDFYDRHTGQLKPLEQLGQSGRDALDDYLEHNKPANEAYSEMYGAVDTMNTGRSWFHNYNDTRPEPRGPH